MIVDFLVTADDSNVLAVYMPSRIHQKSGNREIRPQGTDRERNV